MSTRVPQARALWLVSALLVIAALALDWRRLSADPLPTVPTAPTVSDAAARAVDALAESVVDPAMLMSLPAAGPLRVLFVGNRLTGHNDMPAMIAALARSAHESRTFDFQLELRVEAKLSDHVGAGSVAVRLAEGPHWDAVVLQEQSHYSSFWRPAREHQFFPFARQLHQEITHAGARTVFFAGFARREGDFMNYATDDYEAMQARIIDNHATLARELSAEVVPVGSIWRRVHRQRPALRLWEKGGMLPSRAGSYLAACAFYTHFYGRSPQGLSSIPGVADDDARGIQDVVAAEMLAAR